MPSTSSLQLTVDAQYCSPYAMSVYVGLLEKQLPFTLSTLDLDAGANHAPAYALRSLTARVPALQHGDFVLSESSAITEYLDALFPAPALYPQSAQARARARQIQAWLRSDLLPLRPERDTLVVFYRLIARPLSDAAQRAAHKLLRVAEQVLPPDSDYLFGEWSIVDVDLALMLNRLRLNGDELPQRLADYAALQWQRPSVQAWLDLPRPVLP
ncbi:probable glutathione S-transferase [Aquitalea magnusonii]|uniref:Probable glutathione S-transferase n=1 Tax=Aquitalea magnusonii TaxID=332411 RepID=A0A3G9GEU2_9NEIS|nr:glutathione transferase [Aquitalea magnusonii]BBF84127.1 probable glutathione S-transferase [Aquitalea magnusonii]